jgi:hypothetical protein
MRRGAYRRGEQTRETKERMEVRERKAARRLQQRTKGPSGTGVRRSVTEDTPDSGATLSVIGKREERVSWASR